MNKYKATLDKSGTVGGSINGAKLAQPSSKSDVYTFTPQDFKYENKHYKYIKYTKYNKVREQCVCVGCCSMYFKIALLNWENGQINSGQSIFYTSV